MNFEELSKRQGCVGFTIDLIKKEPELVMKLLSNILITNVKVFDPNILEYYGLSKLFEENTFKDFFSGKEIFNKEIPYYTAEYDKENDTFAFNKVV